MAHWITTAEAVKLSGYHIEYLRQLARDGRIRSQKWGPTWQIDQESLLEHLREVRELGKRRGRPKRTT
jgi:excisionase family DNA binding protein